METGLLRERKRASAHARKRQGQGSMSDAHQHDHMEGGPISFLPGIWRRCKASRLDSHKSCASCAHGGGPGLEDAAYIDNHAGHVVVRAVADGIGRQRLRDALEALVF